MPRFEHQKGRRKTESRGRSSNRGTSRSTSFKDFQRRDSHGSGRSSGRFNRNKREVEMTKVTCSSCNSACEVPFKPSSDKPVYCSDCYDKKRNGSDKSSHRDFEVINEKLDKIMKSLEID